jgi:2-polyprenyl-6-methoxyphenol hydroxylase-like FAD-dependent oxidoreductase
VFGKHKADVLVSGAGPVGLFAAASLAHRGIDVHVYDAEWQTAGLSYALAVHPRSLTLLEEIGITEAVLPHSYRVDHVEFHDGTRPGVAMDFSSLGGPHPYLVILPQNILESTLEDWLHRHKVKVEWKHRVAAIAGEGSPVEVTMERWGEDIAGYAVARRKRVIEKTFPVEARYVVGADGHASAVRHHLGIDYPEVEPASLFAVFEFATDADLQNRVHVVLGEDHTNVLWPLPDGRCRWSFQLTKPEELSGDRVKNRYAEVGRWVLPTLDERRLHDLIAERAPWFDSQVKEIIWSVGIRFERRLAGGFGRGALWLAGDSAHLAGPVGVHSMNVGMAEGHDLAGRLETILRQGGNPDLLEEYSRTWGGTWRSLLSLDGAPRSGKGASDFVSRNAARILACTPASGDDLPQLLGQVGLEMPVAGV